MLQRDPGKPKSHGAPGTQWHILRLPVSLTPPQFTEGPVVTSDELDLSSALLQASPHGGKTRDRQTLCGPPSTGLSAEKLPGRGGAATVLLQGPCLSPWGPLSCSCHSHSPPKGLTQATRDHTKKPSAHAPGTHGALTVPWGLWVPGAYMVWRSLLEKKKQIINTNLRARERSYFGWEEKSQEVTGPGRSLLSVTTGQKHLRRNGWRPGCWPPGATLPSSKSTGAAGSCRLRGLPAAPDPRPQRWASGRLPPPHPNPNPPTAQQHSEQGHPPPAAGGASLPRRPAPGSLLRVSLGMASPASPPCSSQHRKGPVSPS